MPRRSPGGSVAGPIELWARLLVLDSGGLSRLSERSSRAVALIVALKDEGLWPPLVPSPVLIEALRGDPAKDALANRLIKTCDVVEDIPERLARRAAFLRTRARRGAAVDALVIALAEPRGSVLTSDLDDLGALSSHSPGVIVEGV